MSSELIQLTFDKIMQNKSYTVIVLSAKGKSFAIYTEPTIGKMLQTFLTEVLNPRPLTHELIDKIFEGMDIRVKQVIINDVQDTIYFARLFLEQDLSDDLRHIVEIDTRPSDSLSLALRTGAPVFCTAKVWEEAIAIEE